MRRYKAFIGSLSGKKRIIFFIVVFLICIVAISFGIYAQFFYKYSDTDPLMLGIHIGSKKTAEEYSDLKANFLNLFTNEVHINSEKVNVDKIKTSQEVVYTGYTIQNEDEAYYSVKLDLPVLNIDNENAKEINTRITEDFYNKATKIMRSTSEYNVYQVSYVAYINENIISIAIKQMEKVGDASESTTITTYNYNISNNGEVSLSDLIKLKGTTNEAVQQNIDNTIKTASNNSKAIANEYGAGTVRNPDDDMYKISNASTYFLTDDGYVYIIYDYGETEATNEMDIVIF